MFDNYFTLFALPQQFVQNQEIIQSRYYQLQQSMHPDQFVGKPAKEQEMALQYSAKISEAYHTLKDPFARAKYVLQLQGKFWADEMSVKPNLPMEVLMQQMSLREMLETLQAEYAQDQRENWITFKAKIHNTLNTLLQELTKIDNPAVDESELKLVVQQIPFYLRLKSTIENTENE